MPRGCGAGRAAAGGVSFILLVASHAHGRQREGERSAHGGPDGTEAEHGAGAEQAGGGPAANASGPSANADTLWKAPTRASAREGSSRCSAVVLKTAPSTDPVPPASAPAATNGAAACAASSAPGSPKPKQAARPLDPAGGGR